MDAVRSFRYALYIGGKQLSEESLAYIEELNYEENATGPDKLDFTLEDPDFVFLNDDMLVRDKSVVFYAGWADETIRAKFTGYISVIDVDFPETGSPRLTVICMDESHLLNRKKKKRTWKKVRASDVAKKIAAEYGLKAKVESTPQIEDTISQSSQTDIELLTDLAAKQVDVWLCYIENGTLYFIKRKILDKEQTTLTYRKEDFGIKSFAPRINKETKKEETEHSDVNQKTKKVEKGKADNNTPRDLQGKPLDVKSSKGSSTKDKGMTYVSANKWQKPSR